MAPATIVGILASAASITSFLPQAWRIIKERKIEGLSKATYAMTTTGFALWTTYGVLLGEPPLIVTNGLCFLLAAFILMMLLMSKQQRDEVADALDPAVK